MLTTVEVRNSAGELLSLSMENVTNGLYIEDIDGLGPVKASIASSQSATSPGGNYQSSRREMRNILLKLGLEPDYSIEDVQALRERVYNYFMSDEPVKLRFIDSLPRTVDIEGRVETCEPDIFAKEPTMNISILCFKPDFVNTTTLTLEGETVNDTEETLVAYPGTAKTGVDFTIHIDRTVSEITIYHRAPDDTIKTFEISAPLELGDIVTVGSNNNNKYVRLNRLGTVSSLMYARGSNSDWIQLSKGANYIRVYITGAAIDYTMDYTPRYGGL